MMLVVISYGVF